MENGWINDFIEINCPVYLSSQETMALTNLGKQIRSYTGKFGDFNTMRECMNLANATNYVQTYYPTLSGVPFNEKIKEIIRDAVQGQRCVSKRQEILYNNERKIEATVELINRFNLKTITFAQSTAFVDDLKSQLGHKAVAYHSYVKPETRMVLKTKLYKTLGGVANAAKKHDRKFHKVEGGYELKWKVPKKFGVKSLKEEAIVKFQDNRYAVNVICTAKALDQGFDVPDIQLGIDASRTSNPTQHIQRTGRVARNFTYKDGSKKRGIYVNLYVQAQL